MKEFEEIYNEMLEEMIDDVGYEADDQMKSIAADLATSYIEEALA